MPEATMTPAPSDPPHIVLFVEDEPLLRLNAAEALNAAGFGFVDAADAGEALRKLRQAPDEITVVVMDLGLPDLPGEELARRLRQIRSDLPLLVASGYSPRRVRSLFAGMDGVVLLEKPYGTDELVAAVAKLIDASPPGRGSDQGATAPHPGPHVAAGE